MSGPLRRGLDASEALQRTAIEGFGHVDHALDERFCRALWSEIRSGPLRRMAGTFGAAGVRMEIDGFDIGAPFEGFPFVAGLAEALTERVRSEGASVRGLATWRPNEAGIGVYGPGSVGVTAHMDGRWYRRLVAVFTLVGAARFEVRAAREGEPIETWDARAGGVTFLRGPGLAGARDGRPYHAVHGPKRGVRCSLALRMSVRAPEA
ncbi:MAG: hypothetical protein WD965_03790 [Actinomycetota bacterium]